MKISYLALAANLLGIAWSASAASLPLTDLLSEGASIQVGDKRFDDFSYVRNGDMPEAGEIQVSPLVQSGEFGLRFQGPFRDLPGGDGSDAVLNYRVTVLDPNFRIVGVRLAGNPEVQGDGEALVSVTETFLPEVTTEKLDIFDLQPGNSLLEDSLHFDAGFIFLHVQKDILAVAADGQSEATLSIVDQTFVQVPEPSGWALLCVGLVLRLQRRSRGTFLP